MKGAIFHRTMIVVIFFSAPLGWAVFQQFEDPTPMASRFIKLDHTGKPLAAWSGPWACVLDQDTQLIWEAKTNTESIHDGYWSYSWYNGIIGQENWGDCYFEADRCDSSDLIRRTQQQGLCGLTDWRLPSREELQTLLSHQIRPGEALIDKDFFPQTKRGDYWSRDHGQKLSGVFQHLNEGALAVNFADGKINALPYRNAAFIRLVHSAEKNH